MRRRDLIKGIAGSAAAWPLAAHAQQPAKSVIGLLQIGSVSSYDLSGFRQGLGDKGYVEGQNLEIEYRFADDNVTRLPELASDLVRHQVRVIATVGAAQTARAAKDVTNVMPIVFGFGADPVKLGLVTSLNRPGGNVTGVVSLSNELFGKQVGMLHDLLPQALRFGVLTTPRSVNNETIVRDTQAAASRLGLAVEILDVSDSADIDAVFVRLRDENRLQGLLVTNDPLFIARRFSSLYWPHAFAVATIYPFRAQTEAGELMSYGPDLTARDREVGIMLRVFSMARSRQSFQCYNQRNSNSSQREDGKSAGAYVLIGSAFDSRRGDRITFFGCI
jgi:putative tryptophan/tyrosine transport system substrate-binding protein